MYGYGNGEPGQILVTGGAGFIGSHVVEAYLGAGHQVIVVDDLSCGNRENLPAGAGFYLMNVGAPELRKVFEIEKPDVVNHHAAQISVTVSAREPVRDATVNGLGLLNVLECSILTGVKKFIFVSSGGAIYGEADAAKPKARSAASFTAARIRATWAGVTRLTTTRSAIAESSSSRCSTSITPTFISRAKWRMMPSSSSISASSISTPRA